MQTDTDNLFVTAARTKLRFVTARGSISSEDLFDLPLAALDRLAVAADEQLSKATGKTFIGRRTESSTVPKLQLDILKFVIESKMVEAEQEKTKADKAANKAFLKNLLDKKKTEKLESLSEEEIQKQLDALA